MLEIAQSQAAPGLLHRDAVQAEFPHLRPQVAREGVGLVDLGGQGRDVVGGEPRGCIANGLSRVAEGEVEGGDRAHGVSRVDSRDLHVTASWANEAIAVTSIAARQATR